MNIIVACDKNFAIGNKGNLLCHLTNDLKFFKEKTMNKVVVMGRKTAESLPNGCPLKNRKNYVLTRNLSTLNKGFIGVKGIGELTLKLAKENHEDVWIIGGGEIYKLFYPFCDDLYVTEIDKEFEADTFFVDYKAKREWVEHSRSKTMEENGIKYSFVHYKRKQKK